MIFREKLYIPEVNLKAERDIGGTSKELLAQESPNFLSL